MEKQRGVIWKKCICSVLILLVILCAVLPAIWVTDALMVKCDVLELDGGWNILVHGRTYSDATLSQTLFGMCDKGDVVTLSAKLPQTVISNPILKCYSVHSTVDVQIDGEPIYSYGNELYENGELLGYGWHYIALPNDYEGKELSIVFQVSENDSFEGIPGMCIMDGSRMMQRELSLSRFSLSISMFLMLFGILGMFFSLIMYIRNSSFGKIFCIMMFSFVVGLWTFCNSDLILLFTTNLQLKTCLEYISFYALGIPILWYYSDYVKNHLCPRMFRYIFRILLAMEMVLFVFIMLMQVTNRMHLPSFVMVQHVMLLFTVLYIFAIHVQEYRRVKKIRSGLAIGFVLAGVLAVGELIRYNLSKYVTGFSDNKYNSGMQIAALIIVLALFADFAGKILYNLQKETQRMLLEKMAYVDELTGLANRRKCDEEMIRAQQGKSPYAIISLDMNLLKHINDTYGHEVGDAAIQSFAQVLKESFSSDWIVGRMGGDEFFVLATEANAMDVENSLKIFSEKMQNCVVANTDVKLSAAYGCAYSGEADSAHAVYSLADERMYVHKRRSKLGREA